MVAYKRSTNKPKKSKKTRLIVSIERHKDLLECIKNDNNNVYEEGFSLRVYPAIKKANILLIRNQICLLYIVYIVLIRILMSYKSIYPKFTILFVAPFIHNGFINNIIINTLIRNYESEAIFITSFNTSTVIKNESHCLPLVRKTCGNTVTAASAP